MEVKKIYPPVTPFLQIKLDQEVVDYLWKIIAIATTIYMHFGGQTSVIFTDLLQGFILIFAGLLLFFLGIQFLGNQVGINGLSAFWMNLTPLQKLPLAHFNHPPDFNFVGIFWQDGIAGSIGFLFLNQGLIMRFMAAKSVNEGRKAAAINVLFVLPISAIHRSRCL